MSELSLVSCVRDNQHDVGAYYRALGVLARRGPVHRDEELDAWVVTSHSECSRLLGRAELSRQSFRLHASLAATELGKFAIRVFDAQSNFSDSEDARARRRFWLRVLNEGFDSGAPVGCDVLVHAALEDARHRTEIDLYRDVLQPYVSAVVCRRLAVSEEERRGLYPHLVRYARLLDGKVSNVRAQELALASMATLYHRLSSKWEVLAVSRGNRHEWTSDYVFALAAGHESVAYALATVLLQSCGHSEATAAHLVHEAIRFDSPVQVIGRRASDILEIAGRHVVPGDRVLLHIGAANRDKSVFGEPDRFNPQRRGPHLAFGYADSRCPGRGLAIGEAIVFVEALQELRLAVSVNQSRVRGDHGLAGRGLACLPAQLCPVSRGAGDA